MLWLIGNKWFDAMLRYKGRLLGFNQTGKSWVINQKRETRDSICY
jgi:hypothetical protein